MKKVTNILTKEDILELLLNTKDDSMFMIYKYSNTGTFKNESVKKNIVEKYIENISQISYRNGQFGIDMSVINIADNIGLSISDLYKNQYFETSDIDGYMKYVDKYNKYNHIYIKINKESIPKTISFKLGCKEKTLELVEEGYNGYVSKPYRQKYMKCVSAESLERHCNDKLFNPRMINIGKKILKIKTI